MYFYVSCPSQMQTFGVYFECKHHQSYFLTFVDILFVGSNDHNAYPDAATPEIKDEMVDVSDAMPRDFNQEQVRTNLYSRGVIG